MTRITWPESDFPTRTAVPETMANDEGQTPAKVSGQATGTTATATASEAGPEATSVISATDTTLTASSAASAHPTPEKLYPQPKLRLEVRDAAHKGADVFLGAVNASALLAAALGNVHRLLYGRDAWTRDPDTHVPPARSVTVILRDMDGVAYTTGSELDHEHKEIHFSLRYIAGLERKTAGGAAEDKAVSGAVETSLFSSGPVSGPVSGTHSGPGSPSAEIAGVLTHELVHCCQWNALGTAPGGLIEGVADWVRLHCALAPPHWTRDPRPDGRWDAGYQNTAYFLDYLEHRFGNGTVRRLNEQLRQQPYEEAVFWPALVGRTVAHLWRDYVEAVQHGWPEATKQT